MNTYGEQSWADSPVSDEKATKTDFLRLSPGSNTIRILTMPHAYYQHTFSPPGGRKFGYRVNCSDPMHNVDCSLCAKGGKPQRKWFLGVIERKTGQYKILDVPWTIYKGLLGLTRDENWGDPSQYDANILNNPSAGAQRYNVIPNPKKPLSAADLQIKEEHSADELVKKCTPPTREASDKYIESILDDLRASGVNVDEDEEETSTDSNKSGDDDFFKDYDKKGK